MSVVAAAATPNNRHAKDPWAGQINIMVVVRVRPPLHNEAVADNIVRVLDGKVVSIADPGDRYKVRALLLPQLQLLLPC